MTELITTTETVDIFGKTAFAKAYAAKFECTIAAASKIYENSIEVVKEALDAGSTVRLNGIGSLKEKTLYAGTAKKPGTDEVVQVPERKKYTIKSAVRRVEA